MSSTIIHVNRQFIAYNTGRGKPVLPVYTIKRGSRIRYGFAVEIDGPSRLIDPRTAGKLPCGARAWITTEARVRIIGEMSFAQAKALRDR